MTEEDAMQAAMVRAAALAIGDWLEGRGRLHQPIASLTLNDLDAMAANAVSAWILARQRAARDATKKADHPTAADLLLAG